MKRRSSSEARPSGAIVAYAGTGKDTLVAELARGDLALADRAADPLWVVYRPPCAPEAAGAFAALEEFFDPRNAPHVRRFAFADALKSQTHDWLRLRDCPPHAFERVKNTLRAPHPVTGELETIRQHYINYGQQKRAEDPLIWARLVAERIALERKQDIIDIITDFRFDNELLGRDVTTIRLYRDAVPVAAALADRRIDSEHNLDGYTTHFLFTPPGEFAEAVKKFPQYASYVPHRLVFRRPVDVVE